MTNMVLHQYTHMYNSTAQYFDVLAETTDCKLGGRSWSLSFATALSSVLDGLDPDCPLWTLKISSEQHGSRYCIKLALSTIEQPKQLKP